MSVFITNGTNPRGFSLVHLEKDHRVEALDVGTRDRPARDLDAHLRQRTLGTE
jgi:hypothetical protein